MDKLCPKCGGIFIEGFIGDRSDFSTEERPIWGTAINKLGIGMEDAHAVTTYRCQHCGYLESYAA